MSSTEVAVKKTKLDSLNFLRGVAVLMVCFCHFGQPLSKGTFFPYMFYLFHEYGADGVEVFFVISGFIIPYSLMKGKYALADYFTFLYKRFLRLHPPYLVSLGCTLIIMYFSYKARHEIFPENWLSIIKSLIYLHAPMDNPPYWTLNVEAQYYFFIGLFYILLIRRPNMALFLGIPLILLLAQTDLSSEVTLLKHIIYFLIGIVSFYIYSNDKYQLRNWLILAALCVFGFIMYSTSAMIVAFGAAMFILFYRKPISKKLQFPGTISYSIYLIHFPVGVKFINLLLPRINTNYTWALFIVTLALIIFLAWVFYRLFEEFSERLSKSVSYRAAGTKLFINRQEQVSA